MSPRHTSQARPRLLAFGLVVALVCSPTGAIAAPPSARQLAAKGASLYERGQYEAALVKFEAALAVEGQLPEAELLALIANVGRTNHRLGRVDAARNYYQRYLARGPNAPSADKVRSWLAELDSQPLPAGTLVVAGSGARVTLDGSVLGEAPLGPVPVPVGPHTVTVRRGERVETAQIVVTPGALSTVNADELLPPGTTGTVVSRGVLPTDVVTLDGARIDTAGPLTAAAGRHLIEVTREGCALYRESFELDAGAEYVWAYSCLAEEEAGIGPWPWTLGGTGVAVALTGLVFTLVANRQYDEYSGDPARTDLLESSKDNDTVAYALYAAGGAMFLGGLTWGLIAHFSTPDSASSGPALTPALAATDDGGWLMIMGQF